MATPDKVPQSADEARSMTQRMLALIHRFDAAERRSAQPGDGSLPQRRRGDEAAPASGSADDPIVEPAQPE